ncbi:MAG: alpha/beta hydrolase [Bacteroidota bacterium]
MRLVLFIVLVPVLLIGQPPIDRYQTELFGVTESNDVQFSTGVPQPNSGGGFYEWITGLPLNVEEYNTSAMDLQMDIFEPTGDTLQKRPLVIVCFGGGFLSGSKDHWSIRLICQELAKRGYVAAAIDYRLGMNIFDSDLANRAVYRGLQDARSAVRFFRADAANANAYKIDPDHIFIGGHSSGAFMALHNAYLDKEIERPISTYEWVQDGQFIPDQECLDCVGDNTGFSGHANAIFSLAGALGFTSFIENAFDPKAVMFHSTDDGTVPYNSGGPFSSIIWAVIGSDLPTVYGSLPISQQADAVGLPYDFFSYTNRGHDVHEESSSDLYSDIIPGICEWFFEEELKPTHKSLFGDTTVCTNELTKTYTLDSGDGIYFDWNVVGGTPIDLTTASNQITVIWNELEPEHLLSVTPYNQMDAKGDLIQLEISINPHDENIFLHQNNNWSDPSNWSLNHIPTVCEDVTINTIEIPFDIMMSEKAEINSLKVESGISLIVNQEFLIHQKNTSVIIHALELAGNLTNNSILTIANNYASDEIKIEESGSLTNNGDLRLKN